MYVYLFPIRTLFLPSPDLETHILQYQVKAKNLNYLSP